MGTKTGPTEEETTETNQRNRAISSSAITRAMSDANAGVCVCTDSGCYINYVCLLLGDYESAVDILRMAITLIKQSITAGTESNQVRS